MTNKKVTALTPPMGTLEKLGFGCFSMSNNVVFQFKSSFYLFFLTNVLGIGIGGTANIAANLAKEAACLRTVGSHNPDPQFRQIEEELYKALNALGVGIMGIGGDTSVLAVNVEYAYTHIAGICVAISSNCMVARRGTCRVTAEGTLEMPADPNWFEGR